MTNIRIKTFLFNDQNRKENISIKICTADLKSPIKYFQFGRYTIASSDLCAEF